MKVFFSVLCMCFLAGCSSVTMKEPFPDSILTEKEKDGISGIWRIDETVVNLAFASNGAPELAFVEWENDAFRQKTYLLHFTKCNGTLYVSMPEKPNGEKGGYYFAEIKPRGGDMIVWNPNIDVFSAMVEDGTIKGSVDRQKHSTEIKLDIPAGELLELISNHATAFDYKNPLVFQRLD